MADQPRVTESRILFSPTILRRLGEELNPSVDQGILELVKNSYDADAYKCSIELLRTRRKGGSIRITDDGDGMTLGDIMDGWLVLGASLKSATRTTLGRKPAGNKGLGRLAALRLGRKVLMVTRPKSEPELEHRIEIDWSLYDQAKVVEQVPLTIVSTSADQSKPKGTIITLQGLRSKLSRLEVKRLARGILILADPFGDNPSGFKPKMVASEFRDLEKLVRQRYFNDAEYHLEATLDSKGFAQVQVTDWKGQLLYSANHAEVRSLASKMPYKSPPATFSLWIFLLSQETFKQRATTVGEVREWLHEFGGVSLYIDGIRVAPYGNPGNDWLEMNLSRVRHPELRPSTNTSIGRVSVRDNRGIFLQKTDRSGVIQNDEFDELQQFAKDALNWLARRRLAEREKRRISSREETGRAATQLKQSVDAAISSLSGAEGSVVQTQFNIYVAARNQEVATLRREVQLYRTLGSVGITAAMFAHESANSLRRIERNARILKRRTDELEPALSDRLRLPMDNILQDSRYLVSVADLTLETIDHEKRRMSRIDIHTVLKWIINLLKPFTDARQIDVETKFVKGQPYMQGSVAALESIVMNLLVNSMRAFESTAPGPRNIVVRTHLLEDVIAIRVLDNGPGIQGIPLADIWLPGESTYPNGTGLGLTIVRDTAKDLGGSCRAIEKGELGGAEFIVDLPIIGVN